MKVVGIKKNVVYKFEHGDVIGIRLFLTDVRKDVDGLFTESVFISSTKPGYSAAVALGLNAEVQLVYNRYGKVDDIVSLDAAK